MNKLIPGVWMILTAAWLWSCAGKSSEQTTAFTRIDSLTDVYLHLKDSMLSTWNRMMYDDNQRIKAMKALVHELKVTRELDDETLQALDYRIDQLPRIRYSQKTMINSDVVEEYDFASNSLVTELITLAESYPAFAHNNVLQDLADKIRLADQRIESHRAEYDAAALAYNRFIELHKNYLKEIDQNATPDKRPLFQTVSE